MTALEHFASLIDASREPLLDEWRRQVRALPAARNLDTPTLTDHIPHLISELVVAFRAQSNATIPDMLSEGTPPAHGMQRLADGFDIVEVVAEYNILRGCLHELAESRGLNLAGRPFYILNRTFDGAIGAAVQTFAAEQAKLVTQRRGEYLAFVMHDLRTPLNAISLATDFLTQAHAAQPGDQAVRKVLAMLKRTVGQLAALVGKVIDENVNVESESGQKLERRTFDLWSLIEGLVHDLLPVAQSGGARIVNAIPDDLVIFADASLLRRVVQNLIGNALQYAPGGTVTIGAEPSEAADGVEFWVRDDGAGIAADRLDKVFDKHETDPDNPNGLGLGLAIVKTFVEAHGGTVSVESLVDVGTKFTIRLPAAVS